MRTLSGIYRGQHPELEIFPYMPPNAPTPKCYAGCSIQLEPDGSLTGEISLHKRESEFRAIP
jgi:hypothetical protein